MAATFSVGLPPFFLSEIDKSKAVFLEALLVRT
jgi:hypothetical protein